MPKIGIAKIIVKTVRTIVKYSSLVEDSASDFVKSLISRIASLSGEAGDSCIMLKQIRTYLNFYIQNVILMSRWAT